MAGISSRAAGKILNKQKTFQSQLFDDDFGIDYVEFKWRNHDPQIGRFIEIDPLASDYEYNATYAISENKVTSHIELEGLEAITIGTAVEGGLASAGTGLGIGIVVSGLVEIGKAMVNDPEVATFSYKYAPPVPGGLGVQYTSRAINDLDASISAVKATEGSGKGVANYLQSKETKTFDGKQDTKSSTSREAFRKAKEQNGIPRSQQPNKTIKPNTPERDKAGLDNRNVKQHEFTNSKGQKVIIREDKSATYSDGGKQPPHYNAGQNPQTQKDLNQHHNY